MGLWMIEPTAAADDPAWQGRRQWQRVLVRARSPAEARLAAEKLEQGGSDRPPAEQRGGRASGFANEKLYHVRAVDTVEPLAAAVPEGAILEAVARPA